MTTRWLIVALLLNAVFCAPLTAAGIVNGDFETGDLTGWITASTGEPIPRVNVLSVGGNQLVRLETGDFASGPMVSSLSQSFEVTAENPILTFDVSEPTLAIDISGTSDGSGLDSLAVFVGSELILRADQNKAVADLNLIGKPSDRSFAFGVRADLTAFAGMRPELRFDILNLDDGSQFSIDIDNIMLGPLPAAKPEPASIHLAAIALVSLLAGRRTRKGTADER